MVGRKLLELEYMTCASPAYLAQYGVLQHPEQLQRHSKAGYFFAGTTRSNPLIFECGEQHFSLDTSEFSAND